VERRVCRVRGELTRVAEARQVRGRRRALEGHPEDPRGRDSVGPGRLHDRWRQNPIPAPTVATASAVPSVARGSAVAAGRGVDTGR
jgi:hypothetical protein